MYISSDVKANHIMIDGPRPRGLESVARKTMTADYVDNISYSGGDGMATFEFKLRCQAMLSNSSIEDIKRSLDF